MDGPLGGSRARAPTLALTAVPGVRLSLSPPGRHGGHQSVMFPREAVRGLLTGVVPAQVRTQGKHFAPFSLGLSLLTSKKAVIIPPLGPLLQKLAQSARFR